MPAERQKSFRPVIALALPSLTFGVALLRVVVLSVIQMNSAQIENSAISQIVHLFYLPRNFE